MYTKIKVATLVMNSNLVLPGLTGRLVVGWALSWFSVSSPRCELV